MPSVAESLPLTETISPTDQAGVAEAVRTAGEAREAIYPLGGQTSLDYGIAASRPGRGLDLTGLNRIVDYTPRDMTIVVEAGVRMSDLAATLAKENQQLPVDVPRAARPRSAARSPLIGAGRVAMATALARLRDRHPRGRRPRCNV